jgi:hypothetical protein
MLLDGASVTTDRVERFTASRAEATKDCLAALP